MFDILIENYEIFPELYTKQEWIEQFYEAYNLKFKDRLFKAFFKINTENYEKKIKYMLEMLKDEKSSVNIYDIIDYDPNVIWD